MKAVVTVENLSHAADKLPKRVYLRLPVNGFAPDPEGKAHKIIAVDSSVIPWGNYKTQYLRAEVGMLSWGGSNYEAEIEILGAAT